MSAHKGGDSEHVNKPGTGASHGADKVKEGTVKEGVTNPHEKERDSSSPKPGKDKK